MLIPQRNCTDLLLMYIFCNRGRKCAYDITITYTPVCVCVCLRACVREYMRVSHISCFEGADSFSKVCTHIVSLEVIPAPYRLVYYSHE